MRYGVVGVANTCVGYAIFWVGLRVIGLAPGTANAVGYALSLCLSFVLNRHFVFNTAPLARHAAWRFALSFGLAFSLNQALLWALLRGGRSAEIAQLFAMVAYTVVFYLLSKFFVFRDTRTEPAMPAP